MVGLPHYSPSTDMLPRVIRQLVKINHNQDGGRHCLRGSGAPGLTECGSKNVHWSPWTKAKKERGDLEKEKQKKGNKNSMPPPVLFPSAMLSRERMSLWVPNKSERRQMAGYKAGGEAGYALNHPTRRKQIQCVAQERRKQSIQTLQESEGSCIFRWNLLLMAERWDPPKLSPFIPFLQPVFLCW